MVVRRRWQWPSVSVPTAHEHSKISEQHHVLLAKLYHKLSFRPLQLVMEHLRQSLSEMNSYVRVFKGSKGIRDRKMVPTALYIPENLSKLICAN